MLFKTLGIDPGSNSLGFCILGYDLERESVTEISSGNLKLTTKEIEDLRFHNRQLRKSRVYIDMLLDMISYNNPDDIAIEYPFIGVDGRVSAYKPLIDQIHYLEDVLSNQMGRKPLYQYYPTEVKAFYKTRLYHGDSKDKMKQGLKVITEVARLVDIDQMETSDEIDAIAIAYFHLRKKFKL